MIIETMASSTSLKEEKERLNMKTETIDIPSSLVEERETSNMGLTTMASLTIPEEEGESLEEMITMRSSSHPTAGIPKSPKEVVLMVPGHRTGEATEAMTTGLEIM